MSPPGVAARPGRIGLIGYARLLRADILSAQPARLYRAWMAEYRAPFFRSFFVNDPELIDLVLKRRPDDFPKSRRVREGLTPLLGRSMFVANGAEWRRQRRIVDPAFAGGRLRDAVPKILAAASSMIARTVDGEQDVEGMARQVAADVMFRTLFSSPVGEHPAAHTVQDLEAYQTTRPLMNVAAILPLPRWFPRFHRRRTLGVARSVRTAIAAIVDRRAQEIAAGMAPDDLTTRIMMSVDPETGKPPCREETIDQLAIFLLAGQETSAAALSWGLYLLATHPDVQDRVAEEARRDWTRFGASDLSALPVTRDVFRETLRLYPPVPMMVRETKRQEVLRGRKAPKGAQIVISPWHLHRHERMWDRPDRFDPDRWQTEAGRESGRRAYVPFGAGSRVCTGAAFATAEGVLLLARIVGAFRIEPVGDPPVPMAHLTVRSRDGIRLRLTRRAG